MRKNIENNARNAALDVILHVEKGVRLEEQLAARYKEQPMAAYERRVCNDLAFGYFRNKIRIDFIAARFLKKPAKLPGPMLSALGLGIYGLLFQERVPAYAVINETVAQVKQLFGPRMANVANGTLRAIGRDLEAIRQPEWYNPSPGTSAPDLARFAAFYSCPLPLAVFWQKVYGDQDALALMRRGSARPWTAIRINPGHALARKVIEHLSAGFDDNIRQIGKFGFAFAPGFFPATLLDHDTLALHSAGVFSFQSAGSQYVLEKLRLYDSWREPVWDCCCGTGVKTRALLERGLQIGLASDTHINRLKNIANGVWPDFNKSFPLIMADVRKPPIKKWEGNILADVPCSGLGVLARRPDIKRKLLASGFDVHKYKAIQEDMLGSLSALLTKGGNMAYITCTLNPAENESMISGFLERNHNFEITGQWETPHAHPWLEGMFGVVLRKIH